MEGSSILETLGTAVQLSPYLWLLGTIALNTQITYIVQGSLQNPRAIGDSGRQEGRGTQYLKAPGDNYVREHVNVSCSPRAPATSL
jgi:hypothetical protein